MSKSLGNVIDPWQILDTRGADALRWWMFSQGSPWTPTRASLGAIDTAMRDILLTLWNTFSFFTTYASLNGFDPADPDVPPPAERGPLDRWILSRLAGTTSRSPPALDAYEPLQAAPRPRRPGRRPLQLVRAAQPAALLAHRPRRPARGLARRPGHAAHGADHALAPAGALLPVRRRRHVAPPHRRGRGRLGPPGRLAEADAALGGRRARGADGAGPPAHLARPRRPRRGRVKVRQPLARALVFLPADAPELLPRTSSRTSSTWTRSTPADELSDVLRFELVPNFKTLGPAPGRGGQGPASRRWRRSTARRPRPPWRRAGPSSVALRRRAGRADPDDVELRVRAQQGLRRVARRRRGGGARPRARRRPAPAGPGPRGGPPGPGPAQDERARGLGPHPAPRRPASTPWGTSSTPSPARCWPSRSSPSPGAGEGTVLDLDDELLERTGPRLAARRRTGLQTSARHRRRIAGQQPAGERHLHAAGAGGIEHDEVGARPAPLRRRRRPGRAAAAPRSSTRRASRWVRGRSYVTPPASAGPSGPGSAEEGQRAVTQRDAGTGSTRRPRPVLEGDGGAEQRGQSVARTRGGPRPRRRRRRGGSPATSGSACRRRRRRRRSAGPRPARTCSTAGTRHRCRGDR